MKVGKERGKERGKGRGKEKGEEEGEGEEKGRRKGRGKDCEVPKQLIENSKLSHAAFIIRENGHQKR